MGECKCLWYDGSVAIVYKNDMISGYKFGFTVWLC
jgi:hypothetical protein